MLTVNYSTIRNNLKNYCDEVTDNGETVIVTTIKNQKCQPLSFLKIKEALPFHLFEHQRFASL